jgi:hypothetical protein
LTRAHLPPKFLAAVVRSVIEPKVSIMRGRTLLGPNFLPSTPRNGLVRTKGIKNMLMMRLYWSPVKFKSFSRPLVLALPRLPLSRALKLGV